MSLVGDKWNQLVKLFDDNEDEARAWLAENVDEQNRSIENENLITRETEEETTLEVEVNLDGELDKVINDKVEAAIARALEGQEPDTTAIEELIAKFDEFMGTVNQRFEALEKPEQERTQEVIDDMPRKKVQVMYRPRTIHVNNEEVEVVPANEIAANNRPKNAY